MNKYDGIQAGQKCNNCKCDQFKKDFKRYPKISRLDNAVMTITQKIHGSIPI